MSADYSVSISDLTVYAILAPSFFDFSKITMCPGFTGVSESLRVFVSDIISGKLAHAQEITYPPEILSKIQGSSTSGTNTSGTNSTVGTNNTTSTNSTTDVLREKIFLVEIINICQQHLLDKTVSFDTFMSSMNITDDISLIYLLMKALGDEIITGWINSERRELCFDKIMPREMSTGEKKIMREKFEELRRRVEKAQELLK